MEERLCALDMPFMQIRELPRGGQHQLSGAVVNVPCDLHVVHDAMLPRLEDAEHTVQVNFKRMLKHKSSVLRRVVRPAKLQKYMRYLVGTPIYEGLEDRIRQEFVTDFENDVVHDSNSDTSSNSDDVQGEHPHGCTDTDEPEIDNDSEQHDLHACDSDASGEWTESDDDPLHNFLSHGDKQPVDVMIDPVQSADMLKSDVLNIAPGEKNKPMGMFAPDNEERCFLRAFGGQRMSDYWQRKLRITYHELCKHHLLMADRRVASNSTHIFYNVRKMQVIKVIACVSTRLRKTTINGRAMTAGVMRDVDKREQRQLINQNQAFRCLEPLRGSPDFMEKCKKMAFGMLRQLRTPTLFVTLTARGYRWTQLLQMLSITVDKIERTDEEVNAMSFEESHRLIRADLVTYARYYNRRLDVFIDTFMKKPLITANTKSITSTAHHRSPNNSHPVAPLATP